MRNLVRYVAAILLLVSCASPQEHRRMQRLMAEADILNKSDGLFASDSLPRLLVAFHDRHGSPNEQVQAHYLLGCALYDLGQLPAALESFQEAAARADTTRADCDYRLLCRVHGQTARLFLEQEASYDALEQMRLVDRYARLADDTLMRLVNREQEARAYRVLGLHDSALVVHEQAYSGYKKCGFDQLAAISLAPCITYQLDLGNLQKAKECMDEYERGSGLFGPDSEIAHGQEIYYYVKGRYYMEAGLADSAGIFYRKAQAACPGFDEQAAICMGLARLYEKAGQKDSSSFYWKRSYTMLDSAHIQMATGRLQRLKVAYDYTYHRRMAQAKGQEARQNLHLALFLGFILFVCLLVIYIVVLHVRRYKEKAQLRETEFRQRLMAMEQNLQYAEAAGKEAALAESEIRERFASMTAKRNHPWPTAADWKDLRAFMAVNTPKFYMLVKESCLTQEEFDICILVRLHFQPKQINCLTGLSLGHIATIRKRLLQKVFHQTEGGAKDFDRMIKQV